MKNVKKEIEIRLENNVLRVEDISTSKRFSENEILQYLGECRVENGNSKVLIYDELGLFFYSKNQEIVQCSLLYNLNVADKFLPKNNFRGKLLIEGKEISSYEDLKMINKDFEVDEWDNEGEYCCRIKDLSIAIERENGVIKTFNFWVQPPKDDPNPQINP